MKIINARLHPPARHPSESSSLKLDRLELADDQSICLVGTNRSGIIDLFHLICGQDVPITADCLILPENPGIISFKKQQEIFEAELKLDDTDFMGKIDPGTPARFFLQSTNTYAQLIDALDMTPHLDKGYRQLSTGQNRKLIILSQITKGVSTLIILAPFDGLDSDSRNELDRALYQLSLQHIQLILFVHNHDDIPLWCTYTATISHGRLMHMGNPQNVPGQIKAELQKTPADFNARAADLCQNTRAYTEPDRKNAAPLVILNDGSAGYHGLTVFNHLSLKIHQGEHTLVTGPNGCGKSTLLQVITGDHPACYQNDLTVLGFKRGCGESIWDIKKQMGIVSADLHRNYYIPGSTLSCVLSGLFDSIGLYQPCSSQQKSEGRKWLSRLGLESMASTPFRDLSYADQRLVLIARALIKIPKLLVLDEPTHGLDEPNRNAVLDFLEDVSGLNICTLLYVSHRTDEYRSFFSRHIQMA